MPSEDTKERIAKVIDVGRTVLHYAWIPMIIYVGFTRSNPQPSLIKCVTSVPSFILFIDFFRQTH
ncbi:hypothetical protein BT96DRAFT_805988 [Gymnopus androsaceus JB14]|uniref:Tom7-domain-containing protein n=1 Tax=Gymnopus androsaceus JB14 TaxID=1447944 RepID=A0A6A4ICQ8_9AGAR|nr:hypothetical protein BT96DRAFT_805988 [Gymnopus androsaceus JB14]